MKRRLSCLLAGVFMAAALSACTDQTPPADSHDAGTDTGARSIVATTFPQYDWVREILGDNPGDIALTLLLDDGVDLHSYQPTVEDIAHVSACDMFIYVGGESDAWVDDVLETAINQDMVVVNMVEALGDKAKEEEVVEGMEHSHAHSHGEIDPDAIRDRPLADWQGSWTTVETALQDGVLDEYVEHNAHANGVEFEAQKAAYAQRWQSDYEALTISDGSVDFGGVSAHYTYLGYRLVESDHGGTVWYGFEAEDGAAGVPRYIAFSDHGTGDGHGDGHEEEHGDGHGEHESPHFHLRYGDEGFEALTAVEHWSPTYFQSDAAGEEIAAAMTGHGHAHASDEHVWLSLKNAQAICDHIAGALARLDEENADVYAANAAAYNTKLAELDAAYQSAVDAAAVKTLLFCDRFPFRYLADDYGLSYYAAFSGCSAESEASFETIVFLAGKMDELGLAHVMVIEGTDQAIARTVIDNTAAKNQQVLVLDSMQSVTARHVASGTTYLSVMESNLDVLKKALS